MAIVIYSMCTIMSSLCAFMLFRGYRARRVRLLLWSSLSFALLASNNILFFVDVVLTPEINISGSFIRGFVGALAGSLLLYGFLEELA